MITIEVYLNKVLKIFLMRGKTGVSAIDIHYEMDDREITLEESIIPEENETLEAIGDCLQHVLHQCERCIH